MSQTATDIVNDFNSILDQHGVSIVVRFSAMTTFTAGEYDDVSGTFLAAASGVGFSGLAVMQPLSGDTAGEDSKFLEGGIVSLNDSKLYTTGSLAVSGNSIVDISTSGNSYNVLHIQPWPETGSTIYRKVLVRKVTGSG